MRTRLAAHDAVTDLSQADKMSIGDTEDMNTVHSDDNQTITEDTGSRGSKHSQVSRRLVRFPMIKCKNCGKSKHVLFFSLYVLTPFLCICTCY